MATSLNSWIHNFTVTDCSTHKKGYTIYKITSIVFPVYIPEALTCLTVWKRFNEIKKLRKALAKRHKELHLRGTVPDVKETNYFSRFEPDVIEERKAFILRLLDFVAQHPSLYKAHAFINFFEGSHTPTASPLKSSAIQTIRDDIDVPFQPELRLINPDIDEELSYEEAEDIATIDDGAKSLESSKSSSLLSVTNSSSSTNCDAKKSSIISNEIIEVTEDCVDHPRLNHQSSFDTIDSIDYIYEAALEFSEAVRAEVNADYLRAFERYKAGIEKLINGAQYDGQEDRRRIAKEKTEKYLTRAEQIYEKHILNQRSISFVSIIEEEEAARNRPVPIEDTRSIERPLKMLSHFKVIQILDMVMQVQDVTNKQIFIMKAIEKPSTNPQAIYLPPSIPHMVRLTAYFQSDTTIYLLLQQASGGKLWEYIKSYKPPQSPNHRRTSSALASLFSEPLESPIVADEVDTSSTKPSKQFMTMLDEYRNSDFTEDYRRQISRQNSCLSETIESLELNGEIPAFDVLSQEMDVLDLVSCSQKLLQSVTNTLDQSKQNVFEGNADNDLEEVVVETESVEEDLQCVLDVATALADESPTRKKLNVENNLRIKLPEQSIRRWASEIVTCLLCLHAKDILCMDLNPNNLLLGGQGQVLLTYFYRQEQKQLSNDAIDLLYVAPERPLTVQSDWWSLGVILFEMLTGEMFITCHPGGISSYYDIQYPEVEISAESRDLLQGLIQSNPDNRLNGMQIKNHDFFKNIDWTQMTEQLQQ